MHSHPDLAGLARECSNCKTIVHFDIKGRSPTEVRCPLCDHKFTIQKYKRGERPKAKEISKDA